MQCGQCQFDNPADARFCIDCGAALVAVSTGPTAALDELPLTAQPVSAITSTRLPVTVYAPMPPMYSETSVAALLLGFVVTLISGISNQESMLTHPGGALIAGFLIGISIGVGTRMRRWALLPLWGGLCAMVGWSLWVTFYVLMQLIWP